MPVNVRDRGPLPVTVAWSLWQRVRGLLGRPAPVAGTGFLIPRCHAIHMHGMAYPIDVVFLDRHHRVLSIRKGVQPGRHARQRGARAVVEMAEGEALQCGLFVGQLLDLLVVAG